MNVVNVDGIKYYNAYDIMAKYPKMSNRDKNRRRFLRENDIPDDQYIYARDNDGTWEQNDGKSCKYDHVMIRKKYFDDTFVNKDIKVVKIVNDKNVISVTRKILKDKSLDNNKDDSSDDDRYVQKNNIVGNPSTKDVGVKPTKGKPNNKLKNKDITIDDKKNVQKNNKLSNKNNSPDKNNDLPPIINLEDHEKFYNNKGNIVEIEMVGIREYDGCYFKVKDIMTGFGINRLEEYIKNPRSNGYVDGVHYKIFYVPRKYDGIVKIKKLLYVTYKGLIRILTVSKQTTADKFVDWAMKTLFAAQMGTPDQKFIMIGNTLGVSSKAVKEVFNKSATTISCIYLFSIGKVKDLRKRLNLGPEWKDEWFVYKFGMTKDLSRRTTEHEATFGKMKGASLELIFMGMIDPQYISDAETKLNHLFDGLELIINHEKYEELVVIPKEKMKLIKEQYDIISSKYVGHISELVTKLKEKDYEITLLKERHENEIHKERAEVQKERFEKEIQKEKFEVQKEKFEVELLKKDLEIANMKIRR